MRRKRMRYRGAARHYSRNAVPARRRRESYMLGRELGYHQGRCTALLEQIPPEQGVLWNMKVLYVQPNTSLPYIPIDQGIISGLHGLVADVTVCAPTDDVVGLAVRIRPDLVLVLDSIHSMPIEKAKEIRKLGIKTAVWFTDDPYYTDVTIHIAPCYDYVFTTELNCVPFYQDLGCGNVHCLPFGISRSAFRPIRVPASYRSDICFIGTAYWNRAQLIDSIAGYLAGKNTIIIGYWWDRLKRYKLLKNKILLGQWMSPEETLKYYCGAKIVFNLHRLHDDQTFNQNSRKIPAVSVNPRTFDIGASGTFHLTDIRGDICNVYTPGVDLVTYRSGEDLVRKLDYYLSHEKERSKIAMNGLARTVKEHTYRSRLNELFTIAMQPQIAGGR